MVRVLGLVALVVGSVVFGFALGMAQPRRVVPTTGSVRPMAPAAEETSDSVAPGGQGQLDDERRDLP